MPRRKRPADGPAAGRADLEALILRAAEAEFAAKGYEGANAARASRARRQLVETLLRGRRPARRDRGADLA